MKPIFLIVLGLLMASAAHSQPPQQITVLVEFFETEPESNRRCGITYSAQQESTTRVLRAHGYEVDMRYDAVLTAYVKTDAIANPQFCSVRSQFRLYYRAPVKAPWGTTYHSQVVICEKSNVANGPYSIISAKVRDMVSSLTELCMKEEEQKRRLSVLLYQ